jgi:hypothetical protein
MSTEEHNVGSFQAEYDEAVADVMRTLDWEQETILASRPEGY